MNSNVNALREMDFRKRLVCEIILERFNSVFLGGAGLGLLNFKN